MGKIYQGQASLTMKVYTGCVLSGAEETLIKYRKPDGLEGSFPAGVLDETEGILGYDVQAGDLDLVGWWRLWAWVGFPGGKSAPGDVVKVFVHKEGK